MSVTIVYQSRLMHDLVELASRFARSSATVLLAGESGTGKELIAEHIHKTSPRCDKPYVRVNCAALSESLLESELFGHERGAFTGALQTRAGRFEAASGGTLLLDEITEVPLSFQSKLLRVLEQSEFERVGGNETRSVDVRVIATTNRSVEDEVAAGRFREDLYHRLNVLRLDMPPLRSRRDDVPTLATHFIDRFRSEAPVMLRGFSRTGITALSNYHWPGNVRQLKNVVHRACVLAGGPMIGPKELPDLEPETRHIGPDESALDNLSLGDIERMVIMKRLEQFNGNKTAAATALGVTARTLTNKLARYREHGYT
ncbi:MAG: sigma-54 interaction domain-containing protein [Planctomycetaceae bacterium]